MLKLLVEYLGSFIFFYVILKYGLPIPIAIALAAVIYFGGDISGGNFNPGVSLMMFLNGKLQTTEFIQYVLVQCLAAASAVYLGRYVATLPLPTPLPTVGV